jgi:hypothetical protein
MSFVATYALGLWFGSWLIINGRTNTMTGKPFSGGDVVMCFFAIVMGSWSVGQVGELSMYVCMYVSYCFAIVVGSWSVGQVGELRIYAHIHAYMYTIYTHIYIHTYIYTGPTLQALAKGQSSAARV